MAIESRLKEREEGVFKSARMQARLDALLDLGDSLAQAANDLKRVILNGDATAEDLLQPRKAARHNLKGEKE